LAKINYTQALLSNSNKVNPIYLYFSLFISQIISDCYCVLLPFPLIETLSELLDRCIRCFWNASVRCLRRRIGPMVQSLDFWMFTEWNNFYVCYWVCYEVMLLL